MMNILNNTMICAALFFGVAAASAKEVLTPPPLPQDPALSVGSLPNGVKYYMVSNASEKGLAEFALVQSVGSGSDDSLHDIEDIAQSAITDLPRLQGQTVREFMTGNGAGTVAPERLKEDGVIEVLPSSVTYRFGSVPVSGRTGMVDSLFLMMFDIISASAVDEGFRTNVMPTDRYAIVVAGDIDKSSFLSSMKMLSMMVPARHAPAATFPRGEYVWHDRDSAETVVVCDEERVVSSVKVSYLSARTPKELMGTSLPIVSKHMGDVLSLVTRRRLLTEMPKADIPFGNLSCRYIDGSMQPGDERYEVEVNVAPGDEEAALAVVAKVLSSIDSKGVLTSEYGDARKEYLQGLYAESHVSSVPNSHYVDECISAFLYGSSVVSPKDRYSFLTRGGDRDTSRTRIFNDYASGILDSTRNLVVTVTTPVHISRRGLRSAFRESWEGEARNPLVQSYSVNQSDTLSLDFARERVKVKSTRREPVSGGVFWEFSNGMKVVYKCMDTGGLFYYDLMVRGGFSAMNDIKRGEGAFLTDMLETYDIRGLRSPDFNHLMLTNGITMSSRVGVSEMHLFGSSPGKSLSLLMKSLVAVAEDRAVDEEEFDYYRRCERLRLLSSAGSAQARMVALDTLMCPSYNYSSRKAVGNLYPDLHLRAMEFFDDQFSRMNDGVFILVGDMDEDSMKKFLLKNLGGFRTQPNVAARIRLPYQPISGWTTYINEGEHVSVDVAMSAPCQLTADNYAVMQVTARVLQKALNEALCGMGVVARVVSDFSHFPQERVNMVVSLEDIGLEGLPKTEEHRDPVLLLFRVREVLSDLAGEAVDDSDVDLCRKQVSREMDSNQAVPGYWTSVIAMRYAAGKDLNTKYAERIGAVTASKVKDMVESLNSGSKVEYVVRK